MKWIAFIACMFCIILPIAAQPSATTSYRFLYATVEVFIPLLGYDDIYTLHWIDPTNPEAPEQTLTLGDYLRPCHTTSPNGRWLLLCYNDPNGGSVVYTVGLMLMDLLDSGIRSITPVLADSDDVSGISQPQWSPDSRYITFVDYTREGMNSYLYDVENSRIKPITVPNFTEIPDAFPDRPIFRLWSADSKQFITSRCLDARCYRTQLDVLHVSDMSLIATKTIDTDSYGVCNFNWSPDKRYISFQTYCYLSGIFPFNEIFIWDTHLDTLEQITHFTNPPPEQLTEYPPERYAGYSTLWYDEQNLLLSVQADTTIMRVGVDPDSLVTQTLRHQFPGGEAVLLNDNHITEWALNPHTQDIAFASQTFTFNPNGYFDKTPSAVRIATMNDGDLQPFLSLPSGNEFMWSPDGTVLAYRDPYLAQPSEFYFLQLDNRNLQHFVVPNIEGLNTAMLGWTLALENRQLSTPYFIEGTPTPIPTQGPMG